NGTLTWWNSHKRTVGTDATYAMTWKTLIKLMTNVYCLRNEIQKMETELWNLAVKGNNLSTYTQRFQELVLRCTKMVPDEEDRVEKFIGGLPDNIQGNVIAAEPTRLQDAIRITNNLMDQKLKGYATRNAENKRRARAYTVRNSEKKGAAVVITAQRALVENQRVVTCFGCGGQGHYKSEYPKLKNQNHGNKASNNEARRRAYVL
ncbi:putative reverse transcriptase domain-containing protein, partial [Tanacetum coccineum]